MKNSQQVLYIFLVLLLSIPSFSQLNIQPIVTDADCSSNGVIQVSVTGGSGDYRFSLTSLCGQSFAPQTNPRFGSLEPCRYTLSVLDRVNQQRNTIEVDVNGTYETLRGELLGNECEFTVLTSRGKPPYRYFISTNGQNGNYQENNPIDSPVFQAPPSTTAWVRIEDACGSSFEMSTKRLQNPINDISVLIEEGGIQLNVSGGTVPYEYSIISDKGTFRNSTGLFLWDQIGCDLQLMVADECNSFQKIAEPIDPTGDYNCLNISTGEAEIVGKQGIRPFQYKVETPEGSFFSDNGNFESLPTNRAYYRFFVIDACGNMERITTRTRNKPAFWATQLSTLEMDTLLQFSIERQCSGALDLPLDVTCTNCLETETKQIQNISQNNLSFIKRPLQGNTSIVIRDRCGDQLECTSGLVLELNPACDSIQAKIVDRFTCSNNTFARRELLIDQQHFFLLDSTNLLIDSTVNQAFMGLSKGTYNIFTILSTGDTLKAQTTLEDTQPFDPTYHFEPKFETMKDGMCKIQYRLLIEQRDGPFVIYNSDHSFYKILNDYDEDNCRYYVISTMDAGKYTIASTSSCGQIEIDLPTPEFNLQATVDRNCPGDAQIYVQGKQPLEYWQNWYDSLRINIDWDPFYTQSYTLKGKEVAPRDALDYTFTNLKNGQHTIYLHPFKGDFCIADSAQLIIPDYELISMQIKGNITCSNQGRTDLQFTFQGGQLPYQLKLIDCNNSSTLKTYEIDTTAFTLPGIALGTYCFILEDQCNLNLNQQIEVYPFQDSIRFDYACDEMVRLFVDDLPLGFSWKNTSEQILSKTHELFIVSPTQAETIYLEADLGSCQLNRQITLTPREVIPSVEIIGGDQYLCGDDTLTLNAKVSNTVNSLSWNTGDTTMSIAIKSAGQYIVDVENDLGCKTMDTIQIRQVEPPDNIMIAPTGICEDSSLTLTLNPLFQIGEWSNGVSNNSIEIFAPGRYSVIVNDTIGCRWQDSADIIALNKPVFDIIGDTIICPGTASTIQINQNFSQYQWSTGVNSASALLEEGEYTVSVIDENGCSGTKQVNIIELPQVSVSINGIDTICRGAKLEIPLVVNGTMSPLNLEFTRVSSNTPLLIKNQSISSNITFFPSKSDTLKLVNATLDGYNCPVIAEGEFIVEAKGIQGEIIEKSSISCFNFSDGALEANFFSDFSPLTYQWNNNSEMSNIFKLKAGDYSVQVKDRLGCTKIDTFTLLEPLPLAISTIVDVPHCFGIDNGQLSLLGIGGVQPYNWFLNMNTFSGESVKIENLAPGDYLLGISDQNGCSTDTFFNFPEPVELMLDLGNTLKVDLGESINLEPKTNFTPANNWIWTPQADLDRSFFNLVDTPFISTVYQLQLFDEFGCDVTASIQVDVNTKVQIFNPTAFSPNGDGINDYFTLYGGPGAKKIISLSIFDRWGSRVFYKEQFPLNKEKLGWDGTVKGKSIDNRYFTWVAEILLINNSIEIYKGEVGIFR